MDRASLSRHALYYVRIGTSRHLDYDLILFKVNNPSGLCTAHENHRDSE